MIKNSKLKFFILLLSLFAVNNQTIFSMEEVDEGGVGGLFGNGNGFLGFLGKNAGSVLRSAGNLGMEAMEAIGEKIDERLNRNKKWIDEVELSWEEYSRESCGSVRVAQNPGDFKKKYNHNRTDESALEKIVNRAREMQQEDDEARKKRNQLPFEAVDLCKGMLINQQKAENEKRRDVAVAGEQASKKAAGDVQIANINAKKWENIFKYAVDNKEKIALAVVGGFLVAYCGYKAIGIISRYIETKLYKPVFVKETSRVSFIERMAGKKKKRECRMDDFVASPELFEKVKGIADDIKDAHKRGAGLSHMLLYGPPGTGKTMFAAHCLASYSGLDWAIVPGSTFSQGTVAEALDALTKMIEWGRSNKNGTVIFIDEVDGFLSRRTGNSERDKLITQFLSMIEKSSDPKLMFVFATNRPQVLDPAVLSRVDYKVRVPAPEKRELVKLFDIYIKKISSKAKLRVDSGLKDKLEDFSELASRYRLVGRDVEAIIMSRAERLAYKTKVLTSEIVEKCLNEFVSEKESCNEDFI